MAATDRRGWQGGWWWHADRRLSPHHGPRPPGDSIDLVIVHSISLPPGEYELSTWHEFKLFAPDKDVIKVTVTEGGDAKVEVTYAPKRRD